MLSVDHYELIRRKRLVDGLSIRAISRELGYSRKTIRKALKHVTPPGNQRCQPVALPVMDRVAPIVHAWLEQDRQQQPKQRHTRSGSTNECMMSMTLRAAPARCGGMSRI